MAWYEATMGTAAGELLAILDGKLPLNAYWSIYDPTAGTNRKVYRNNKPAENSNYYVDVNDNYTGYAAIALWEGWDAVNHIGSGNTTSGYIKKDSGAWGLSVLDLRFIFVNRQYGGAIYVGQVKRHDLTKDTPILICWVDASPIYNPLGATPSNVEAKWACLRDQVGVVRNVRPYGQAATYDGELRKKTTTGKYWILEHPVHETNEDRQLGFLDGAAYAYYSTDGLLNNDIVIDTNSIEWLAVLQGTTYCCLVRKN